MVALSFYDIRVTCTDIRSKCIGVTYQEIHWKFSDFISVQILTWNWRCRGIPNFHRLKLNPILRSLKNVNRKDIFKIYNISYGAINPYQQMLIFLWFFCPLDLHTVNRVYSTSTLTKRYLSDARDQLVKILTPMDALLTIIDFQNCNHKNVW